MDGSFLLKALDTCTFLWLVRGDAALSPVARDIISATANDLYLSVVSAWEIGVKFGLGKLPLPAEPRIFVSRERSRHLVTSLALSEAAALVAADLPLRHRDLRFPGMVKTFRSTTSADRLCR